MINSRNDSKGSIEVTKINFQSSNYGGGVVESAGTSQQVLEFAATINSEQNKLLRNTLNNIKEEEQKSMPMNSKTTLPS